jgi:DUF4097 and DUF4098 domain-containing protein YvlB
MKLLTFMLVLSLGLAFTVDFTSTSDAAGGDPTFTEYYKIGEPATVKIATAGGYIKATEGNAGGVTVEFYVRKGNSPQKMTLEELKKEMDVEINSSSKELDISVKSKEKSWNWKNKLNVSFVVYTPRRSACVLQTSGGHLEMTGLAGTQVLSTSGGKIIMENIQGEVVASTSGGHINASNIEGNLTTKTSGGHIHLDNIEGNSVAKTSGGHVNVSNLEGNLVAGTSGGHIDLENIEGNIVAKTSGGHISLNDIEGAAQAQTSGGSIKGSFSSISGPIDLATSGGSINIDVPDNAGMDVLIKGTSTHVELGNFKGTSKRNLKDGTVNGGGVAVKLKTSGGSATLR